MERQWRKQKANCRLYKRQWKTLKGSGTAVMTNLQQQQRVADRAGTPCGSTAKKGENIQKI